MWKVTRSRRRAFFPMRLTKVSLADSDNECRERAGCTKHRAGRGRPCLRSLRVFPSSIAASTTRASMFCETSRFRRDLLEGGFLSNPVEGQRIATAQYRQQWGSRSPRRCRITTPPSIFDRRRATFAVARQDLACRTPIRSPSRCAMTCRLNPADTPSVSISGGE